MHDGVPCFLILRHKVKTKIELVVSLWLKPGMTQHGSGHVACFCLRVHLYILSCSYLDLFWWHHHVVFGKKTRDFNCKRCIVLISKNVCRFHIGREPLVIVADGELCKQLGIKNFKSAPNRSIPAFVECAQVHKDGLFFTKYGSSLSMSL